MKSNVTMRALSGAMLLAISAGSAFAGPWTSGNLIILQASGAPTLSGIATQVTLREFGGGVFTGNDLAMNGGAVGTRLTISGSSTSEGQMNLSEDGRYLTFAGYDAALGTAAIVATTTATVNRVVASVDLGQNATLNRISDTFSAGNIRSATSTNGATFAATGSNSGVRGLDPTGGNTTTTSLSSTPTNLRVARYDLGARLFVSSSTGVFQGVSEVVGGTTTLLPGFPSATGPSAYDFEFVTSTLLYVADDRTTAAGGLQRWELVSGTWTLQYTIAVTSGLRSIAVTTDAAGNNLIYGVSGGALPSLVSVVDTGAASLATVLATSATGAAFRAVEFVPVPAPGTAALLGLAGLAAARRRR